jgi:Ni,Fe-hydrogenase III small subunit
MSSLRVFHLDTGGCGACAAELWASVESSRDLLWAPGPAQADVVALTGCLTPATRDAVVTLYHQFWEGRVPLVAIGRCAIDGYPYGKLGVAATPDIRVQGQVESCPPLPAMIVDALLNADAPQGARS